MKSLVLLFCMALVGVKGCSLSKSGAKLSDVKWILETLDGKKVKLSDPGHSMFIQFDEAEKRVNGRAACNRFFGNYEINGNKLKFSPMGATRMNCPDMPVETRFFQMLDKVDVCTIEGDTLLFESKGEVVAVFKKEEEKVK